MRYALIKNGKIDNIIEADYTNANLICQNLGYNEAVNVDLYKVGIGASYENGQFLTAEDIKDANGNILIPKGTVIERQLSAEEAFNQVSKKLFDTQTQLTQVQMEKDSLGKTLFDLQTKLTSKGVI